MPMSQPPTAAEISASAMIVATAYTNLALGVGSSQFCTLLAAAIQVMQEQRNELISAYNANCGTYVGPNDPGQP